MSKWDEESFYHTLKGKVYTITKYEVDISEEWGKPRGTVEITHKIEGFEMPLYLITDTDEKSFGFGHKVVDDETDTGLFVTLQDEDMFDLACMLILDIGD